MQTLSWGHLANFWKGVLAFLSVSTLVGQSPPQPIWKFAVSGDSRNCGDIVMPAIGASVLQSGAKFYWHLGDFRAIYDFDEDMVPPVSLGLNTPHMTIASYLKNAWPDFIERQLGSFVPVEVFLAIGNHETTFPQTRERYIDQFEPYLNSTRLRAQREKDGNRDSALTTYYHWVMNDSVDFFSLDNATGNAFDEQQLTWVRARLAEDARLQNIRTIVVGMHEALPGSKGFSHSMCDSSEGVASGREVYELLWNLQQAGKRVYLLASHSHFVMEDVFHTPYWGDRILSGWIVGTAGAVRYRLPAGISSSGFARTDVYGYLLGTVMSDGSIQFDFHDLTLDDLRAANAGKSADSLVRWCFNENADQRIPKSGPCGK